MVSLLSQFYCGEVHCSYKILFKSELRISLTRYLCYSVCGKKILAIFWKGEINISLVSLDGWAVPSDPFVTLVRTRLRLRVRVRVCVSATQFRCACLPWS